MAQRNISASFLLRRDTAANWESKNPILADGEYIAVKTNSGVIRYKLGDGSKRYNQLPFSDEPLYNALAEKSNKSISVNKILTASAWSSSSPYTQIVSISGLLANQNGVVSLSTNASASQIKAAKKAILEVTSQANNQLTITAKGVKPTIEIPLTVILFG